ncbi:MAG: hypothetical protein HY865_09660 [Chloroflexi bacterium]|nr:hypothetical protein [Chloroflexota bacterium]
MSRISAKKITRRIRDVKDYKPPLTIEQQQAVLFIHRATLNEMLVLLNMLKERDEHIKRLLKGNSQLTRLLEKWIIDHPIHRIKAKEKPVEENAYEVLLPPMS